MDDLALARALHVAAVTLWIGGVAFVTTVLLPAVRREVPEAQRIDLFERIEGQFAWQSRATTLIAGLSGLYMLHGLNLWARFLDPGYWWMHAMVLTWLVFTLMLFVLEPLLLHRWFRARAERDPAGTFRLVLRLHRVLLTLGLATVLGAVAGSHGWYPF